MSSWQGTTGLIVRDLAGGGLIGGIAAGSAFGESSGWSFLLGCLWLALNFTLLAWLLSLAGPEKRPAGSFIFWLVCAKIPASYLLLYWLYTADYLNVAGLTAGLLLLPVVLVWRGIAQSREGLNQGEG